MEIKLSGRYTWEAIHRVSLINIVLPLMFPTSRIEPGRMGLPENNNKYKAEYTNTQQDLLDKKIRLDMQGFSTIGFVLLKATKS
jgi:hypothetical protein